MNNLKTQFLGFINTPYLFDEINTLTQFKLDIKKINEFDFNKLNITEKLPLGKRIERFFEFYINQSSNYEFIKSNVQIIHNKQTLGELDFLIYDKKNQKYLHIEHIYKYYLYDTSFNNEIDRFIGPNKDDSFIKKIDKLKNKQLPLLYKSETRQYLYGIDINNIEQKVCFKGNIYVPLHLLAKKIPIVNNNCIKGFYIKYKEFVNQEYFKEFEYFLPLRDDWVSDCNSNQIWKSFDEVITEIELLLSYKKSSLVWLKNKKEDKIQSFFITWW
ncbi:DUF1853 family protein [Arcobacter sp. CECT 8985]|uniref:DUF1853 family protein n=1 Tax=Arcobacter sp. CECT 8985 TaxID=1935424 RepID=UPI0013E9991E|nr:DUF1853 family protein [Arcobacter sp. CECT 8985]